MFPLKQYCNVTVQITDFHVNNFVRKLDCRCHSTLIINHSGSSIEILLLRYYFYFLKYNNIINFMSKKSFLRTGVGKCCFGHDCVCCIQKLVSKLTNWSIRIVEIQLSQQTIDVFGRLSWFSESAHHSIMMILEVEHSYVLSSSRDSMIKKVVHLFHNQAIH